MAKWMKASSTVAAVAAPTPLKSATETMTIVMAKLTKASSTPAGVAASYLKNSAAPTTAVMAWTTTATRSSMKAASLFKAMGVTGASANPVMMALGTLQGAASVMVAFEIV
jgi:hypothetical protein